jgi:hypothetical protein
MSYRFEQIASLSRKERQKKKDVLGYKGAQTLEEEWAKIVHEVYDNVSCDSSIDHETLARLKNECEQLEIPQVRICCI